MKFYQLGLGPLATVLKPFAYIVFFILYTSCAHKQVEIVTPSQAYDDEKYQPVLVKWSRNSNVYKDLELRFKITAVLVAPEMEEAYRNRIDYIYGQFAKIDDKILLKKDTIAVILDFFGKPDSHYELSDESVWKMTMKIKDSVIPASEIHPYKRKEGLKPFFPLSSYWSRHYIVLFKIPNEVLNGLEVKDIFQTEKKANTELPTDQENLITFSMNSGEAQIKFSWDY